MGKTTNQSLQEHYDQLYKKNDAYWGFRPSPFALLAYSMLDEEERKNDCVLDLGCGQGRDALFFAEKGLFVTAIDISEIGIASLKKHAKKKKLKIATIVGDMHDLPQEKFDIIFSDMALQMVHPKEREAYIKQLQDNYLHALHVHIIPIKGACFGEQFICDNDLLKKAYSSWNILAYEETWNTAMSREKKPFLMREARIIVKRKKE